MKTILVSIDGTLCDSRHRSHLEGTPDYHNPTEILKDSPVKEGIPRLQDLSHDYALVYLGKRPTSTLSHTEDWLNKWEFPPGSLYTAETHEERLLLVHNLSTKIDFLAGIGTGWEDNEYHRIGACLSIILKGDGKSWGHVPGIIRVYEREEKIKENEMTLQGKIQGLVTVLPLLHSHYGDELWDSYVQAMSEIIENSRGTRREEELRELEELGFHPDDLRDIVRWYTRHNEDMYNNPNFGLQDWEITEAEKSRCEIRVTRCRYAELWKQQKRPDIGYQLHCRPDETWLDRPAWNPCVRFEHPKTLMQGDDHCLFIHYIEE